MGQPRVGQPYVWPANSQVHSATTDSGQPPRLDCRITGMQTVREYEEVASDAQGYIGRIPRASRQEVEFMVPLDVWVDAGFGLKDAPVGQHVVLRHEHQDGTAVLTVPVRITEATYGSTDNYLKCKGVTLQDASAALGGDDMGWKAVPAPVPPPVPIRVLDDE